MLPIPWGERSHQRSIKCRQSCTVERRQIHEMEIGHLGMSNQRRKIHPGVGERRRIRHKPPPSVLTHGSELSHCLTAEELPPHNCFVHHQSEEGCFCDGRCCPGLHGRKGCVGRTVVLMGRQRQGDQDIDVQEESRVAHVASTIAVLGNELISDNPFPVNDGERRIRHVAGPGALWIFRRSQSPQREFRYGAAQ